MKKVFLSILIIASQLRVSESELINIEPVTEKLQSKDRLKEAIKVIKYFETLSIKPIKDNELFYVGYGCRTLDSVSNVTQLQADSLLMQVMRTNKEYLQVDCDTSARFFNLGVVLAFSIGHAKVSKSKFWELVKNNGTSKDIKKEYLEFQLVNKKPHANMLRRRELEFEIWK